jgi:tRNA A37 threonylcarbamoyladenosine synthetase subunit TsaC/SUA5/YrdC
LSDIAPDILEGVDIVLDGGELSGMPSTVVDLTRYERDRRWSLLREAALSRDEVALLLSSDR